MNAALRAPHRSAIIAVGIACAVVLSGPSHVRASTTAFVTRITAAQTVTNVQISIVASAPVEYQFVNVQPNWIVLQVAPAELRIRPGTLPYAGGVVKKIRVGQFAPQVVRVVVEMSRPMPFRVLPLHDELALVVGAPGETETPPSTGRTLPNSASAHGGQGVVAPSGTAATPGGQGVGTPSVAAATSGGQGVGTPSPAATAPGGQSVGTLNTAAAAPRRPPQTSADEKHAVLPGEGIGPIRLGMRIQDALNALGPAKNTQALPDGNTLYLWFAPPTNRGIGLRATPAGVVYRVWVLNDEQYAIGDRVRIGNTEPEARAALGAPSQVLVDSSGSTKTLTYPSLGLWLSIQMDQRYTFYGRVFELGVAKPEALTPGQ